MAEDNRPDFGTDDIAVGAADCADEPNADAGDQADDDVPTGRAFSPRRFLRRQVNRVRLLEMCGEGYSLRGARTWIRRTRSDWRWSDFPRREIRRAHQLGFAAHQMRRYQVAESLAVSVLSEREYDLLHPLSGRYGKWVDDRVTSRMAAGTLSDRFECMHVNIVSRNGELLCIPLSDKARVADVAGGGHNLLGFLRSFKDADLRISGTAWASKVSMRVRPATGGFLRGEELVTDEEFLEAVARRARKTPLVVREVSPKDDSIAELGENMFGSVRILACNPSGTDPFIADAHMRIIEVDKAAAADAADGSLDGLAVDSFSSTDAAATEDASSASGAATGQDPSVPLYYAAQISLDSGTYAGARAYLPHGMFVDTPKSLASGCVLSGSVLHWDEIKAYVLSLMKRMPQVELLEISLQSAHEGFRLVRLNSSPSFNRAYPFPERVQVFLKQKARDKREICHTGSGERVRHAAFLRLRRRFTKLFYPAGMVFYQGLRYPQDVIKDLFSRNGIALPKKLWAYRHGFLSYRLDLYPELSEETWCGYVTDFEYRWLRHINPKYRTWMEDKITLKYVLARFPENLPAYYFFTSCRAGENRIVPLMDCPKGLEPSVESILALVRECGALALKPDEGSHGEGFCKLSYEDGAYLLNGEPTDSSRIESILLNPANQYLVTEYIELHPRLREIYPGAVNSVRVTVFKRDGVNPELGNAYFRIGSSRTGAVDNVVAGGLVAEVDVKTGRYGDARTLVDNRIVFMREHPDTGVIIEGVLPHWETIRERVLDLAREISQLEYMGFDVAITEGGFKLLEVNRYPDYPRISRLTDETISYLLQKIEDKKRFLDIEHDRSLFKLPRRSR